MQRTGAARRRSRPSICIRQELSPATHTSAFVAAMLATLSLPIAVETSAFFTAKVPPNPQHSSLCGSATKWRPRTAASSRTG